MLITNVLHRYCDLRKHRTHLKALFGLVATIFMSTIIPSVASATNTGILRVHNQSPAPQTFVIASQYMECVLYPAAKTPFVVAPNGRFDLKYQKDAGSDCDGEQGRFLVYLMQGGETYGCSQAVDFDSDALLRAIWNSECPTAFPSNITAGGVDPIENMVVYDWWVAPPVSAQNFAQGRWETGCEGGNMECGNTLTSSLSIGNSNSTTNTESLKLGFSTTVKSGFKVLGQKGEASATYSSERTSTEATTIAQSQTAGVVKTCNTPVDMNKYNVYKVWQWVVSANVGGTQMETTTCTVTCTPDGAYPNYLPGDKEAISACFNLRGADVSKSETPKHSKTVAMPTSAEPYGTGCVDFYSGPDGIGTSLRICDSSPESWEGYRNLGNPKPDNAFHQTTRSFRCAPGVGFVQFINGNANPPERHNESCKNGATVNPNAWVTSHSTGVGLYRKPHKCCGE